MRYIAKLSLIFFLALTTQANAVGIKPIKFLAALDVCWRDAD
jgi:hypothetical protein